MDTYLLNSITEVWVTKIRDAYISGSIPSERHLQAELFHAMKLSLSDYQIYVEPYEFKFESHLSNKEFDKDDRIIGYIPDLVITKSNNIIAIIEIKYTPHLRCEFKPDMLKLQTYESYTAPFSLTVDYLIGDFDKRNLVAINNQTALIFMGIAKSDSAAFQINYWKKINNLVVFAGKVDINKYLEPIFCVSDY